MLFPTMRIFLWKHYKSMRLTWFAVLLNVAMPIGLTFAAMYLFNVITNSHQPQGDDMDRPELVTPNDIIYPNALSNHFDHVYYAPNTTDTFDVMERVRKRLQYPHEQFIGFASEAAMANHTQNRLGTTDVSVVFGDITAQGAQRRYTIGLGAVTDFHTEQRHNGDFYAASQTWQDPYLYSGFSQMQVAIDQAVLAKQYGDQSSDEVVSFQKMPSNIRALANFQPFLVFALIAWMIYMFTVVNMVLVPMVEEKELGIREFLRIATTYYNLNLFTFYVLHVLLGVLIFGAVVAFGALYGLTAHFSAVCALVLVLLYVASAVAYAFLVSVLFNTVFYAKNAGFILFLIPWAAQYYEPIKFLMPIVSSTLFTDGWALFDEYGARAQVFGLANIGEHRSTTIAFSMLEIWGLLLADTIGYALLYTYLVQVFPGTYGTPQPFYYPLLPLIRLYRRNELTPAQDQANADAGEESSVHRDVVVRVRGLTKDFGQLCGKAERAVNNVSMDICANQITVLLGHNGAGKTTTMSIISGIIPKTAGEITVNGERDVNVYRKKIGYCPQHNVFLPYFTCMDHLQFFGGLRGLDAADARDKSRALLERLQLADKANEYGKDLSGGMKRRLCLGNALIGDTKIAILDEPSSGLDPESRRELWNILIEMRKQNTILITTHYMEEAETLADYISIMSRGEILCHGTSLQLKRRYAEGYVLKLMTVATFEPHTVLARLKERIPGAKVKSFVKPTLSVTLPYSHLEQFGEAIADLENNSETLNIESISLTNASLEEVFLNCDPQKHSPDAQDTSSQTSDQVDSNSYAPLNENKMHGNCALWTQQVLAVFYKKSVYVRRHWLRLVISLTILLAALYFGIKSSNEKPSNDAARADNVNRYGSIEFGPESLGYGEILLLLKNAEYPKVQAFQTALRQELQGHNVKIHELLTNETLHNALLNLEKQNVLNYHEQVLFGLSVAQESPADPLNVLVLYSGNVLHSTARGQNFVSNVLARMQHTVAKATGAPLQLVTVNHPMPVNFNLRDVTTSAGDSPPVNINTEWYKLLMPTALFFYMFYYAYTPFAETNTEFKPLQIISPSLYWAAYYAFDMVQHLVICVLLFGVHLLLDRANVFTVCEHAQLVSFYVMYGLAYMPLVYVIAQIFSSLSTVYSVIMYLFMGPAVPALIFTASAVTLKTFATWVSVLLVFPDYALRHAINVFLLVHPMRGQPAAIDDELRLCKFYVYMALVPVVLFAFLVLVLENIYRRDVLVRVLRLYRPVLRVLSCRKKPSAVREELILGTRHMAAVDEERDHTDGVVAAKKVPEYAIVVSKLHKVYDGFAAVRGLDFSVRRGECFGLLGMNGAGKTTTFKMMTRDVPITSGAIYFKGISSREQASRYRYLFGYCPQSDALNGWLTAYETLKYMGLARGTRLAELDGEVHKLLRSTDLDAYADVQVRKFSGGTKRKLNTAIAMQSDPQLVFLDEPTTGVDPSSRRFMWACMQECQRQNKNIVLTSHSMDECEFLCNRLAIMNHGQLNCIGPIQQLKRSFGLGYLITILLREGVAGTDEAAQLKQAVLGRFACTLREEYGNQLCFVAQSTDTRWSEVFESMLDLQKQFAGAVEDISLSESSLEDIFLKIARESHVGSPAAV